MQENADQKSTEYGQNDVSAQNDVFNVALITSTRNLCIIWSAYFYVKTDYEEIRVMIRRSSYSVHILDAYSQPCQTSKMKCFATKHAILGVWQSFWIRLGILVKQFHNIWEFTYQKKTRVPLYVMQGKI